MLLAVADNVVERTDRLVIVRVVVHQHYIGAPLDQLSFDIAEFLGCRSCSAGITAVHIPVKIMIAKALQIAGKLRHDARSIAADGVGTSARKAGDCAPYAKFVEEQVAQLVEIFVVDLLGFVDNVIFVLETVQREGVSLVNDSLGERIIIGRRTQLEEGRFDVVLLEDVEDLWRRIAVWAIVKRQIDHTFDAFGDGEITLVGVVFGRAGQRGGSDGLRCDFAGFADPGHRRI